jgi:hypothetical protein
MITKFTLPTLKQTSISLAMGLVTMCSLLAQSPDSAVDENEKNQRGAVLIIESGPPNATSAGTGFACIYRNTEFVATNLHVLGDASGLKVQPQNGAQIKLSGKVIVAEDADICLLGIEGRFEDAGITPLEFMSDAFEESKAGDEILCFGNSLGNGVITTTKGTIKAFGKPRIEIDCPVVGGNSGGPIIHNQSGKVAGLVTLAVINKSKFDELGVAEAASKSEKSQVSSISYFGHRIDTVQKWKATTLLEYSKTAQTIKTASKGLESTVLFLVAKEGWEKDRRLSDAWKEYSRFIDQADRSTKRVVVTAYVNEFGFILRQDVRKKGIGIPQVEYDKAYQKLKRSLEWKILADQEILKRAKPIGYMQINEQKMLMTFSDQVLSITKKEL